jgi:acyl-coenzyme A thioesterase PaaI-like protein
MLSVAHNKPNVVSGFIAAVPALPADFNPTPYSAATNAVPSPTSGNVFQIALARDWGIGLVPQGGYVMSVVASAVEVYFATQHAALAQPDLITMHTEFLGRTVMGPGTVRITDLKLGRQFSTVRAQLWQSLGEGAEEDLCLEATVTQGNLAKEEKSGGISLATRTAILKEEIPTRETCVEQRDAPGLFERRTAYGHVEILLPPTSTALGASGPFGASVRDQWIRWRPSWKPNQTVPSGFSISSLCFLADAFIPLIEAYGITGNWFPTMSCSVEVKKAPPTEKGWQWLFMRVEARVIKNGRNDIDVIILDEEGEIVALSRHTCLAVSAARNVKVKGAKI